MPSGFERTRTECGVVIPVIAGFPAERRDQDAIGKHRERDADDGKDAGEPPTTRTQSDDQTERCDDETEVFLHQQQQQCGDDRSAQPTGVEPLEGNSQQRDGEGDLVEVGGHRRLQSPGEGVCNSDQIGRGSTECAPAEQPHRRQGRRKEQALHHEQRHGAAGRPGTPARRWR